MIHIHHVLCLHVKNVLIYNISMTKSLVSIFIDAKRGVPNRDLFIIILFQVFYFTTIMLFVSNIIPIELSVVYSNKMRIVTYCIYILLSYL
jgi:hypothetical protein